MTNEEIKKQTAILFERLKNGDESARNQIFELNIKLAYDLSGKLENIALKYAQIDKDDLFQVACLGLLKAIDKFDPEQATFSTFAITCMRNDLFMYNRQLQRNSEDTILNMPIGEDGTEMIDFIEGGLPPEEELAKVDRDVFKATIQMLPNIEQRFLQMRFVTLDPPEKIAKVFDLDPSQIDYIEKNIFSCIKKRCNSSPAHSILFKRQLYFENLANFKQECYNALTSEQKKYFDLAVLSTPVMTHTEYRKKFDLSNDLCTRTLRGIDNKVETFYLKHFLKIKSVAPRYLQELFVSLYPEGVLKQDKLLSIMTKRERIVIEHISNLDDHTPLKAPENDIRARRNVVKKIIFYEKTKNNSQKMPKNIII